MQNEKAIFVGTTYVYLLYILPCCIYTFALLTPVLKFRIFIKCKQVVSGRIDYIIVLYVVGSPETCAFISWKEKAVAIST